MAREQPERGHLADASGVCRALSERDVAEQDGGVESAKARDQCGRRTRVETVRVPYNDLGRRPLHGPRRRRVGRTARSLTGWSRGLAQVLDLRRQTAFGLGGDLGERGAGAGRHDRRDEPFDARSG